MMMYKDVMTAEAGRPLVGLARPFADLSFTVAPPSGTLVLCAKDMACRALEGTGTIAASALWIGPGM